MSNLYLYALFGGIVEDDWDVAIVVVEDDNNYNNETNMSESLGMYNKNCIYISKNLFITFFLLIQLANCMII